MSRNSDPGLDLSLARPDTCMEALAKAPVAFFLGDSDGHLVEVNREACLLTGYGHDELLALCMDDLFSPEVLAATPLRYDEISAGKTVVNERPLRRRDGGLIWVQMHSLMLPDSHCVCFMHDISQRKGVENDLRNSMRKYRELFEKTDEAILIIDGEHFVDCNQATVRMLRYGSKEELLNTHPSELSPPMQPDGQPSFAKAEQMMRLAMEKGSHRFEWEHKKADGEVFPVEVLLTAVSVEDDRQILHTVWRDITERKLAEEKLLQAQKLDSIGLLAGGVAHDFNNMLGGILGYASMLLESESRPDRKAALREIQRAAERSADLTRKLLAFARKGKHLVSAVDLNDVAGEVISLIEHSVDKNITICFDPEDDLPTVDADPGQMHQMLMNLAVNASQAMPGGGMLTIRTHGMEISEGGDPAWPDAAPGPKVVLEVSDTGVGMNEETRIHAFEPFFSTHQDGAVKGTGLGLSTVYGIVHSHNGRIHVSSAPGEGTTMTVCLPRGQRKNRARPTDRSPSPVQSASILVIEDEDIVRGMAERVLETMGHRVFTAPGGRDGCDIYKAHKDEIDGVLLDLKMPGMDGKETLAALQAIDPEVKVLLTTGFGLNEESQQVLDAGALGLVPKPYRLKDLQSAVGCLLK